jgi:hypothetical protein
MLFRTPGPEREIGHPRQFLEANTRQMSLQHRAGTFAHGCDAFGIRGQADERLGKLLHAAVYFC